MRTLTSYSTLSLSLILGSSLLSTQVQAEEVCRSEPQAWFSAISSVRSSVEIQSCKNFDPDGAHVERGNDPVCGEFGLNEGERVESFQDALGLPCELIRLYRPDQVRLDDPLADLALACNLKFAEKRLKNKVSRNPEADEKISLRDARAKACAKQVFDRSNPIPANYRPFDPANPWSNYARDLELIEGSALTEEEKTKARDALTKGKLQVEGRKNPIDVKGIVETFETVMAQEQKTSGIAPKKGEPIRWSQEFRSCVGKAFAPYTHFSKTLGTLAIGLGMYLNPTGKEAPLHDWVMQQPDGSIEPAELFRQSYRLNDGDVYQTILTIENLLSRAWLVKERDQLEQTRKLRPIVHGVGPEMDTYGSWYHFFGTLLHGYSTNGFSARMVAEIEALGSFGLDGKVERQETHINRSGSKVGARLRRELREGEVEETEGALEFESYIQHEEDLTRKIRKKI